MFSNAFQFLRDWETAQYALAAAIVVAIVCSLLSVFVVLKRMAFVGQGVSHAGYGAAGTALLLGLADTHVAYNLFLFAFCIAVAWFIGLISRRRSVNEDTAIGILLAAGMAWGVFALALTTAFRRPGRWYWDWYAKHIALQGPPPSFEVVLFGSLLNTTLPQLVLTIIVAALIVATLLLFLKEIIFFVFDEPTSQVFGVRTGLIHYLLLTLLGATVVLTMKLAGVLLVAAILVVPGATALMLSRRLSRVLVWSCIVGVAGVVGGMMLSLELGFIGPGACIVGVLCAIFGLAYIATSLRRG